jgi:hypothetical protein
VIGAVRKGGMARWGRDVSGAEARCRRPRAVVEAAAGGGAAGAEPGNQNFSCGGH